MWQCGGWEWQPDINKSHPTSGQQAERVRGPAAIREGEAESGARRPEQANAGVHQLLLQKVSEEISIPKIAISLLFQFIEYLMTE